MKHIISVGGGFASTILLPMAVVDKYGIDNVEFIIATVKNDNEDVWRMVLELEKMFGKKVKKISATYKNKNKFLINAPSSEWLDIWDVFFHDKRMISSLADPCSKFLKRTTIKRYIKKTYPKKEEITIHVGIQSHEIDRTLNIKKNWNKLKYKIEFLLSSDEYSYYNEIKSKDLLGWTPKVYAWGGSHNNCGGFCGKAGHANMYKFLINEPELYSYHERKEYWFQRVFDTNATIMRDRKMKNGISKTTPLSLRDFRIRCENGDIPKRALKESSGCLFCNSI